MRLTGRWPKKLISHLFKRMVMQRVYLLLRNNKQSGPYTLEELVQQGLNFFDLIWVEGKSASWSYPVEIEALKPFVSDAVQKNDTPTIPQNTNQSVHYAEQPIPSSVKKENEKKIFVSLPIPSIQQPVEHSGTTGPSEAEKKNTEVPFSTPKADHVTQSERQEAPEMRYNRTLQDMEEEYTTWVYNQKTKKKDTFTKQRVAAAAAAVAVTGLAISYFFIYPLFSADKSVSEQPQIQTTKDETTVATSDKPMNLQSNLNDEKTTHIPAEKTKHSERETIKETNTSGRSSKQEAPVVSKPATEQEDSIESSDPSTDDSMTNTEEKTNTASKQKKKTLGERIDDFFGKFSKKEEPAEESTPKTAPDPNTGIRKSKHRGDERTNPSESPNITDLIDITLHLPNDNWMMGIQGLKVSLNNRSNERIETASVEIRYYDEKDNLLDKKLVQFTNVPPKRTVTVSAPDHRTADHADYRLVSVQSKQVPALKVF